MKRIGSIRMNAVMAVALAMLLLGALPALAASNWASKITRFSATAGETLAVGNVVAIKWADGKAWQADANDSTLRPAVGVIGKGGAADSTVEIVVEGILTGQTTLSPGVRLYLSETAAAITATAPTNAQVIGWVLPGVTSGTLTSSGRYYIRVQVPSSGGAAY